jgi:hypothetical protein
MNCKVGDRVRFLNDVGGGKVTRIIDKRTVAVMNEDGFEVPVLESEIILIDPTGDDTIIRRIPDIIEKPANNQKVSAFIDPKKNQLTGKEEFEKQDSLKYQIVNDLDFSKIDEGISDPEGELLGVFIAFVPVDQINIIGSDHELFIINDSPYRTFYTISAWEESNVKPIKAGFLHADTKEFISIFKRDELNKDITLNIQLLFFKNSSFVPQQPEYCDLSINPTKFYRQGSFAENDFFDEKALVLSIADSKKQEILKTLTDKAIKDSISQKDTIVKPETTKQEPDLVEVDLHIHELVENYKSMQPGEILEIQLSRFLTAIETGIRSKTIRKMVFIHGLGNGKLKNEVIKKLNSDYPKLRYQDASFKEYGYGATLVFLK